jgi:hypothetical protein
MPEQMTEKERAIREIHVLFSGKPNPSDVVSAGKHETVNKSKNFKL